MDINAAVQYYDIFSFHSSSQKLRDAPAKGRAISIKQIFYLFVILSFLTGSIFDSSILSFWPFQDK